MNQLIRIVLVLGAGALFALGPTLAQGPTSRPKTTSMAADLDTILTRHVRADGVDYAGLRRQSRPLLDALLKKVEKQNPKTLKTKSQRIAFYVNAYNAHVLRKVLALTPKQKRVLDRPGFFDRDLVSVAGSRLTLNALEKRARDEGDPRVHFVVNCASASCPPLARQALTPKNLEATLASATRAYLADTRHGLSFTKKGDVALSKIFEWYAKDFAPSGKSADVLTWIRKQVKDPALAKRLATKSRVTWKTYDWKLNQARR